MSERDQENPAPIEQRLENAQRRARLYGGAIAEIAGGWPDGDCAEDWIVKKAKENIATLRTALAAEKEKRERVEGKFAAQEALLREGAVLLGEVSTALTTTNEALDAIDKALDLPGVAVVRLVEINRIIRRAREKMVDPEPQV